MTTTNETTPVEKKAGWRGRLSVLVMLLLVALAVFLLLPAPIDPVAYAPGKGFELTGPLAPNEELRKAEILAKGQVDGPEDVDVDAEGRIYGGTVDGKIVRIAADGKSEVFAETGGRPLGMDFDGAGNLVVCDADKGLLSIDRDGKVTTLATEAEGARFGFADDVDVAPDGKIYFSDASDKFGKTQYMLDLMEGRPHGRLLVHDPVSKETKVLARDLYFANGVAVDPAGEFVLVNETYRYRVSRYWLAGPKAGTADTFLADLPGFPDGISTSPRGTFWVAMFTVRNDLADRLAAFPFLRKQLVKLPQSLQPAPEPYGLVLELDKGGQVLRSLHDPDGVKVSVVTSVHEDKDGHIYLGTLLGDFIARLDPGPAPTGTK